MLYATRFYFICVFNITEHNSDDNDMEWDNGDDGIIKDCQMIEVTLSG